MPRPLHVPIDDPLEIAAWMRRVLDQGATPHLFTFPSSALRLCEAAVAAGIDLGGAQFTVGGEPVTDARLKGISKSGAHAAPRYGSMECGPIGYGCLAPTVSDDTHLQHDLHALIQPGASTTLPADALFITALHPRSPFTLFNVSMGDRATLSTRPCGCPLEKLEWTTHVHSIRSFEKLTAGGMTFFDTDVIRVLEEELPAHFGGSGSDYQLVEQEMPDGSPGLSLLIDPALGSLDATAVIHFFTERIGGSSSVERMMGTMWRESGFVTVKRRAPLATNAGKVLHLHSAPGSHLTPSG